MEWVRSFSSGCPEYTGGCISYPLTELQKEDTDLGLHFYFLLHVYNDAGHFVTLKTTYFQLPSLYPPGHAVIIDLDPVYVSESNCLTESHDVDYHLSDQIVCAKWNGFSHHERIDLEFGIGSLKGFDDIYNFSTVNETVVKDTCLYCVSSPQIPDNVTLFVSIRATSSGGNTISSSDGVIINNETRIMASFTVSGGPECFSEINLVSTPSLERSIDGKQFIKPNIRISQGKQYTFRISGENISSEYLTLQISDAYINQITNDQNQIEFTFQSFTEFPTFTIIKLANHSINVSNIELYDCVDNPTLLVDNNSLTAHWRGLPDHFTYEVAGIVLRCQDTFNEACIEYISPFSEVVTGSSTFITRLNLLPFHQYYIGVRPCLNSRCLPVQISPPVEVEPNTYDLVIITSKISMKKSNCSDVFIEWQMPDHPQVLSKYQWNIIAETGKSRTSATLLQWKEATNGWSSDGNISTIQV